MEKWTQLQFELIVRSILVGTGIQGVPKSDEVLI